MVFFFLTAKRGKYNDIRQLKTTKGRKEANEAPNMKDKASSSNCFEAWLFH